MPTSDADSPVLRLADLVATQAGAIVSRPIMKTKGGTVTVFAFGAGEGLSEHTSPHEALLLALEGAAEITIAGERHHLTPGEALRLPPDVPHAVYTEEPFKMLLTLIKRS